GALCEKDDEALTGESTGQAMEPRNTLTSGCRRSDGKAEGNIGSIDYSRAHGVGSLVDPPLLRSAKPTSRFSAKSLSRATPRNGAPSVIVGGQKEEKRLGHRAPYRDRPNHACCLLNRVTASRIVSTATSWPMLALIIRW